MKALLQNGYRLFLVGANSLQSLFLLFVRLYWGWQFAQTGWGKVNNIDKVIGFFTNLGIPEPAANAHLIAWLELGGGILLALGLASRLSAVPLTIDMLVAYLVADREAFLSIVSNPDKFEAAAPYKFLFACLIVLIFGPGKFALDALLPLLSNKSVVRPVPSSATFPSAMETARESDHESRTRLELDS